MVTVNIDEGDLALLHKKEREHDDFVGVLKMMREQTAKVERKALAGENPFGRPIPDGTTFDIAAWGYHRALTDIALMIVQSAAKARAEADR